MPALQVHIAIAKKISNNKDFILGNILPDICTVKNISHKTTHYNVLKKISIDLFLKEYKDKLNNPIIKGFLVHLLTDEYFNKYTSENHYFKNNNTSYTILNDGTICSKDIWKIKQNDFAVYGNNFKNKITTTNNTLKYIKDLPFITNNDLNNIIKKANDLTNYNGTYKMFTKNELDNVFNKCIIYIKEYLKRLSENT